MGVCLRYARAVGYAMGGFNEILVFTILLQILYQVTNYF